MPTLLLWKPYGVLCQFTDPDGRPTLADFVQVPGVYAAGRLDQDTEGLLILTSDGALQARLTQPKFKTPRTYWAQVEGIPTQQALESLRNGVQLKDGPTLPAQIEPLGEQVDLPDRPVPIRFRANIPTSWLALTLTEGRNRQVRRMTAAVGHPTLRLVRVAHAGFTLSGLAPGQFREATEAEVRSVFAKR